MSRDTEFLEVKPYFALLYAVLLLEKNGTILSVLMI